MSEVIQNLKSKLQLLGKKIAYENDFALAIEELDGRFRVYKLQNDGKINNWLSSFTFEECEIRDHFILLADVIPRYKCSLYVKYNEGDILGGLKVKYLEFDVQQTLPVIGVALSEGVLICNNYGEIHIIKLPEYMTSSANIPIIINPELREYTFMLRQQEKSGAIVQTPIAHWDFKFNNFRKLL